MSTTTSERMKLVNHMEEPSVGWQVRNPEDDFLLRHNTYYHLAILVKSYRIQHNFPVGSNFEADLQNWMCQDLPPESCRPAVDFNPETATVAQKAVRFTRAITRWAKEGFPVVSDEVRDERMATCSTCPYYRPDGNLGMGQCTAPGCGCTKIKLWLSTSACNHPGGSLWKR